MPLLHCNQCQHEWESTEMDGVCDWCGADSFVLVKVTEFEKFCKKVTDPEFLEVIKMLTETDDHA